MSGQNELLLQCESTGKIGTQRTSIDQLVIAGWTGRDPVAVERHIRELEEIGVPPPKRTPIFYRVGASLLTTAEEIQVAGGDSSGEVEFVLFSLADGLWVGVGSDHTDRKVEAVGVTLAKQLCPKPVGTTVWRYADVQSHWDQLILRSYAYTGEKKRLYQEGPVTAMRYPEVACCAVLDAVLAGERAEELQPVPLASLRFAAPQRCVLDGMDTQVAAAFEQAKSWLAAAGAQIVEIAFAEVEEIPEINAKGGFTAAEAWAWHKNLIDARGELYDPRVLTRILRGKDISAEDLATLRQRRADLIRRAQRVTVHFDALLMPTVPIVAPEIAPLTVNDDAYSRTNLLVLRNPAIANFLDRCALSLPCSQPGQPPVGLMLMGEHGADRRLLGIGLSVEKILSL